MGAYINKDLKELIITLASVIGFGDVLVKTGRLHQEDEDAAGPEMCSWARHFVPVKGWKATPTMLYANNASASKQVGSFHVRSCPEFVEG